MADDMDRVQQHVAEELARNLAKVTCRPLMVSAFFCEECDGEIPAERRAAVAGVQTCITCQDINERKAAHMRGAL